MIQGVVALLEVSGRFLVGRRAKHKKSAAGYWCPISGKIEAGESEATAVVREVFEEAGLRVEPVRKIAEFDTRDQTAHLHWWVVRLVGDDRLTPNDEHSELRWVTIEEMRELQPFFEEDLEVYERFVAGEFGK